MRGIRSLWDHNLISRDEEYTGRMSEISLVCMVGGLSSRFGGRIKGFARIGPNGETLVECILDQALGAGVREVVFVVSPATEGPFTEVFGSAYRDVPVKYARQNFDERTREKPWGTVDAVCAAGEFVHGPFLVSNGDDLCGEQSFRLLVDHLGRSPNGAAVGFPLSAMLPGDGSVTRGVYELNEDGTLKSSTEVFDLNRHNFEEKGLTIQTICNVNLFGFHLEVLDLLSDILSRFKVQHQGDRKAECLLPTEVGNLIAAGKLVMDVYASDDIWIGITNPEDEQAASELLKRAAD